MRLHRQMPHFAHTFSTKSQAQPDAMAAEAAKQDNTAWQRDLSGPEVCVLSWVLAEATVLSTPVRELVMLHSEILALAEMVGGSVLATEAVSGAMCFEATGPGSNVTPQDWAVRFGQLLCRWAAEQEHELHLRIGVHTAALHRIGLPTCPLPAYLGPAIAVSRSLAINAPMDTCVHFQDVTRDAFSALERLPFSVYCTPHATTYYLDPWTEAEAENDQLVANETRRKSRTLGKRPVEGRLSTNAIQGAQQVVVDFPCDNPLQSNISESVKQMGTPEFTMWLSEYGVDTSRFGKGAAKSLEDFRREINEERKSYLVDKEGILERRIEIVRINLHAKAQDGVDRSLKVLIEIMADGRVVQRNQKLATVVQEGYTWKDAVKICFAEKFGLTSKLQSDILSYEGNWVKEERMVSPSIPGITTVYLTHEVRINVEEPELVQNNVLGLPLMRNFATTRRGSSKTEHWTWCLSGTESTVEEVFSGRRTEVSEGESE